MYSCFSPPYNQIYCTFCTSPLLSCRISYVSFTLLNMQSMLVGNPEKNQQILEYKSKNTDFPAVAAGRMPRLRRSCHRTIDQALPQSVQWCSRGSYWSWKQLKKKSRFICLGFTRVPFKIPVGSASDAYIFVIPFVSKFYVANSAWLENQKVKVDQKKSLQKNSFVPHKKNCVTRQDWLGTCMQKGSPCRCWGGAKAWAALLLPG